MVIFLGTGLPSKGLTAKRPLHQSTVMMLNIIKKTSPWHASYINIWKISNKIRIGDKVISSNEWPDLDKVYIFKVQPPKNIIIVICSYLDWISPFRFLQRNGKPENRNHFSVKISFTGENFEKIKALFLGRSAGLEWWIVRRGSTHENHQNNGNRKEENEKQKKKIMKTEDKTENTQLEYREVSSGVVNCEEGINTWECKDAINIILKKAHHQNNQNNVLNGKIQTNLKQWKQKWKIETDNRKLKTYNRKWKTEAEKNEHRKRKKL